ncbi:chromate transporter [Faecalimonas canis]
MIYLQLFLSYLQIGAFSFGGGYAAMSLIQAQVVDKYHWLTIGQFTDLVTIAEMTPGPIAINSATFVGTQIGGFFGALCATVGCILPSCIIVTLLAKLYIKYRNVTIMQNILSTLRPVVVSMIAVAGLAILLTVFFPNRTDFSVRGTLIFITALVLLRKTKLQPVTVMIGCGIFELIWQFIC